MIEILPATADLTEAYYGNRPRRTFRGWVGVLDGKPVGVCGIYREDGQPYAFSEFRNCVDRKTIVRAIRLMVEAMDAVKGPLLAIENKDAPTAPGLLKRLGFVPTDRSGPDGRILVRVAA